MIGAELEANVAHGGCALTPSTSNDRAQVVGRRRHSAENPLLDLRTDPLFLGIPQGFIRHRNLPAVLREYERIREIGDRRHGLKIRRKFSGALYPVFPGLVVCVDAAAHGRTTRGED